MGDIYLGTSGWSYKEWVGLLYETDRDSKLRAYSRVFATAEIDSTFYAYPSRGTVMGWLRYVNPDFVFAAKMPQVITHKKKLDLTKQVDEDVKRFCQLMAPLQQDGKLGCILIQLPPSLDFELEKMERFFEVLPAEYRFAVEFRHLSWIRPETWDLLRRHRIAYVVVDEPLLPPDLHVTTDFVYFRWHGKGRDPWYNYRYDIQELASWVPKIQETAKNVDKVYGYFNNHYHGYAVENCLQVLEMLGKLTPKQREAKDSDVLIQKHSKELLAATVKKYHVVIDFACRKIMHDCPDWKECALKKQLCKHVAALMLRLREGEAVGIAKTMRDELDQWAFLPHE